MILLLIIIIILLIYYFHHELSAATGNYYLFYYFCSCSQYLYGEKNIEIVDNTHRFTDKKQNENLKHIGTVAGALINMSSL